MAAQRAPSRLPAKSQFLRPTATTRSWLSAQSLSVFHRTRESGHAATGYHAAAMSLPKRVRIGPRETLPVKVCALPCGLNGECCLDGERSAITIDAAVPEVQKHLTLFHELLHLAEEKLVLGRLIPRRSSEERIGHLATTLFAIVATSGLWKGVSPKDAARYYARMARPPRARRRLSRQRARARSAR